MNLARVGDHVKFFSGFAFKSKFFNDDGTGLPVVRIRDVVRGHSETFYSGEYDERYVVSHGEYLIGMDGEFNLARWQSERALLNQRVCKIDEISEDIDRDYLGKFLPVALKEIEDATPFVTVKHLSVKALNEIRIPLPSLAEQKRIAGILDAADALRAKRRESLAQLDTFLQSTFLDMFGDPVTNPKGWEMGRLSDIVERLDGGKNVAQSEVETDYRVLKVSAVTSGQYRPEESKYLPADFEVPESYLVRKGDLLISRANTTELIGATAYVWETPESIALPDKIWKFIWNKEEQVEPLYIYHLSQDAEFRRVLGSRASGTSGSMKNIAKPKLLSLPIPRPPIHLQHRFAAIAVSVEHQKASQRAHLDELDTLFASLQSRAFRGDL